ncbi:MAG: c-type cytochrome [Pseudomonadota bacterium]
MRKHWQWILAPALMLCMASAMAQSTKSLPGNERDPINEKEMAYLVGLCEGCHGVGGRSLREEVPALAGRDKDELFAEIERFYFYERICPDVAVDGDDQSKGHMSMCDVVNQMNKQEAQALAAYFEAQPVSN